MSKAENELKKLQEAVTNKLHWDMQSVLKQTTDYEQAVYDRAVLLELVENSTREHTQRCLEADDDCICGTFDWNRRVEEALKKVRR